MSEEIIAILAVGVAFAGLFLAWKTSQKNGELSVEMEKRTREHRAFANRFTVITDVEAEAQSAQEKLATVKATHSAFVNQCQEERTGLEEQYRAASHIYEELKSETVLLEENLEDISFGLYEPHFEFDTAEDYKVELKATRDRHRKLVRSGGATKSPGTWTINGSRTEGKKMERQYTKVMLRAFNGECAAAASKVSWNNASKMEQRVEKAFADINKLGAVMNMSISAAYLKENLNEIRLTHEHQEKKYREREEQRDLRQQMREQEKAERELEKAKEEAEREEERNQEALEKARDEADRATGQQLEKLTEQIAALERKVSEAHDRKEKVVARAQLTKSGFVYVLSNVGTFGEGIVKIGMTRRMEPMDRVKELSDASVPFQFDTHVMMFSNNAPDLEQALHAHFEDRRVNLVNPRKEFYRDVGLDEVEEFIRARGVTAQFVKLAEAREYRETQAILIAKENVSHGDDKFPENPFSVSTT